MVTLVGAVLLSLLIAVGCHAVPEVSPPVALPEGFSAAGVRVLPDRWWRELEDPDLSTVIEQALDGNFDLKIAWDRLAQAEAVARREGAPLLPTVNLQGSTTRTEITSSAARGAGTSGRNDFTLGGGASWEIDLWGRIRATHDAAQFEVASTVEEVQSAAVTLSAEIATHWYELAERRAQLALLNEQVAGNKQVLALVTLRFRKGQVAASDVLRQRQLYESTRGERAPVRSRIAVLEHQIAVLTGRVPRAPIDGARASLVRLPLLPITGLPSELVTRRPDIRGAHRRLLAADRRVVVALADRFPRLSLTGSASFSAEDLRDVIDNWIATMTVNLIAPIIDGGRRRSEIARNEAVVSERLHELGAAVLEAFREVEDALSQEREQRARIQSLDTQLVFSQEALERLRHQYFYGSASYLDILQALVAHQELQRNRVTADFELVRFRIDLYRALAGGFTLERPELAAINEPEKRTP